MKTGILGGTFDPVHNAHLKIAGQALNQLELDEILFIPTSHTPLKEDAIITPVEHRVKMLELAIAGNPVFKLSRIGTSVLYQWAHFDKADRIHR